MNWGDVIPAIQQGVIEGVIGGTAESNYTVFGDAVKYFIPYKAFVENTAFYIGQAKWDSLAPEQQAVLSEAFAEASRDSFALSERVDEEYIRRLPEIGIQIIPVSDMEISARGCHGKEKGHHHRWRSGWAECCLDAEEERCRLHPV